MKLFTADSDEYFEKAYGNYMELLKKMGVEQLNEYLKTAQRMCLQSFHKFTR